MHLTTLTRLAIVSALAFSLATLVAPVAGAAVTYMGSGQGGTGHCWDATRMYADPPTMTAAPNLPTMSGGALLTGGISQDIGFRVVLQHWSTTGQWVNYVVGPLQTRTAILNIPLTAENWFNPATKTWSNGTVWFGPLPRGYYYRFVYYLYWYWNGQISGSGSVLADNYWEYRDDKMNVPGWSSPAWCRY